MPISGRKSNIFVHDQTISPNDSHTVKKRKSKPTAIENV